ncbi:MAG: 5-formyltetrahydrofolate cyclo-ligase [Planctomycetaceae bacterium]|nr:5-formyltetrahydrofolate cyclo-ligase [Planctomycetaceae bacterium]
MSRLNKSEFRQLAQSRREATSDRAGKSRAIWQFLRERFLSTKPTWVCCYVDITSEVITQPYLQDLFLAKSETGPFAPDPLIPKLAIPYCLPQHLNLFHLQDWSELATSKWGLQEPATHLRAGKRIIEPQQIDIFLIPGLAFDHHGNRLGYGKGYYDKLLGQRRRDSLAIALAFQEQIFSDVPHQPEYDVPMDYIVTESGILDCQRHRHSAAAEEPATRDLA